ncbi:MAG TPA: RNA polymerase sigma-54 factor [Cytophagales bacterium]|nr:RNA polymerase sigma-54 factor [Cytophagales bacterium]
MQKQSLQLAQQQKLTPQQIQYIKLLQIPTAELDARIEEELEANPALEEGEELPEKQETDETEDYANEASEELDDNFEKKNTDDEFDASDYADDDFSGYKMQGDFYEQEEYDAPLASTTNLYESLLNQLEFLNLSERKNTIAKHLIGSIENDGYIRRDLYAIANDLAFTQDFETDEDEIEEVLFKIQEFDPAGIGARDLAECLYLQLVRKDELEAEVSHAKSIVKEYFEEFSKKQYERIKQRLGIGDEELKKAIDLITHLNPKPGDSSAGEVKSQYLIPDFILVNTGNKLEVVLNSKNAPELRVSSAYREMFETYDKSTKKDKKMREAVTFVKQKLDSAKWFINAIQQRQQTLLKTMNAILKAQYDYFLEGEESKLKPMVLKDVASVVDLDISTVSRIASNKSVQTDFGVIPLKFFFSEGISTDSGEDVSSREVKSVIKEMIEAEEKSKPLADEKLEEMLNEKGYNIARRTVAKYREQMGIPVARLRKKL